MPQFNRFNPGGNRPYRPISPGEWIRIAHNVATNHPGIATAAGSYLFNQVYPAITPPSSGESTEIVWADTPMPNSLILGSSRNYPPPNPTPTRARKRLRFGSDTLVPPTPSQSSRASSVTALLSQVTPYGSGQSRASQSTRSPSTQADWLRLSTQSRPSWDSEFGLSTQSRLVRRFRKRSQASQQRHLFYLRRFVANQKLRFLLRHRARKRPRRHYLATAVRQSRRRLANRRKRYLFVRPSQRRSARLLVSSAKKALWKAQRAYRNASFSQA